MANFLTINGVQVALAADGGAELRHDIIGDSGRSVDGSMFAQRTAIKRTWDCTTPPVTAREALALEGLIHGRGHVWDFASSLYSSRGALLTASGGSLTRETAIGAFGATSVRIPTGVTMRTNLLYPAAGAPAPTLACYLSDDGGASWKSHVYLVSAGQWYRGGSAISPPSGLAWTYSGSFGWQLANTTGGNVYVDDLWVCPYDWPDTWPVFHSAITVGVGLAPRVKVAGLAVARDLLNITAFGEVNSMPLLPGVLGSYQANLHTLSFSLQEE